MKTMRAAVACAVVFGLYGAAGAMAEDISLGEESMRSRVLTVYADGFAQVEEVRAADLPKGQNHLRILDVAAGIVPESTFLQAEGISVREMSVRAPMTDPRALLTGRLGKTVKAVRQDPRTGEDRYESAILLAVEPHPILRIGDRLETNYPGRIVLPITPDTPVPGAARLDFVVESERALRRDLVLQYLLPGLRWQADYAAVYDEDKGRLTLRGWIGVTNGSDDVFQDVNLRVVAGNVSRVAERPGVVTFRAANKAIAEVGAMQQPPAVAGYRLYPIAKKVSIAAGERKQVAFVKHLNLPVTRSYRVVDPVGVFRSAPGQWPQRGAFLRLAFTNPVGSLPLPAGVARVMAVRNNDADLFLGEDRIDHVAAGEPVSVQLGRVVDVTYEAQRLEFRDISRTANEQRFNITLSNDGDRPADVEVTQSFPGQWTIFGEEDGHTRKDAQTASWNVTVPPKGRTNIAFSVRISSGG